MDNSQIATYPNQFDPSQLKNPYTKWAGIALPNLAQYAGTPTDALGNPIASYQNAQTAHDAWNAANPAPAMPPSTSLNSSPSPSGPPFSFGYADGANNSGGYGAGISGAYGAAPTPAMMGVRPQTQQAAPTAPQTNPVDMGQAYLAALSNPGKVTTPGATVPQAALPSNQSGVLQQFLNNWQQGGGNTQGAGNYNNAGFFSALKGGM